MTASEQQGASVPGGHTAKFLAKAVANFTMWGLAIAGVIFGIGKTPVLEAASAATDLVGPWMLGLRLVTGLVAVAVAGAALKMFENPHVRRVGHAFVGECASLCNSAGALSIGAVFVTAGPGARMCSCGDVLAWQGFAFGCYAAAFSLNWLQARSESWRRKGSTPPTGTS